MILETGQWSGCGAMTDRLRSDQIPDEFFIYEEEVHDVPANAWPENYENGPVLRYVHEHLAINNDKVRMIAKIMCSADGSCEYCARNLIKQFMKMLDKPMGEVAADVFKEEFDTDITEET